MAYIGRKTTGDSEPLNADVYIWSAWALERIREALDAGEEPPQFRQTSPWHWIYLSTSVNKAGLRDRVYVDSVKKCVRWEPPDGADAAA